jgi:hypothetical protein
LKSRLNGSDGDGENAIARLRDGWPPRHGPGSSKATGLLLVMKLRAELRRAIAGHPKPCALLRDRKFADSPLEGDGVAQSFLINRLDWQTGVTPSTEDKGLFRELANRRLASLPVTARAAALPWPVAEHIAAGMVELPAPGVSAAP